MNCEVSSEIDNISTKNSLSTKVGNNAIQLQVDKAFYNQTICLTSLSIYIFYCISNVVFKICDATPPDKKNGFSLILFYFIGLFVSLL